jgi:hypothetical protein
MDSGIISSSKPLSQNPNIPLRDNIGFDPNVTDANGEV